ncbi:ATPase [Sulfitobacter sp. SK012]|uniref:ATP12 family chaperone protein n=1 Tax=Sulfitobacter sp. SK012 TaxID=1389005 RepID=UPI000E0AA108|nr:ATP12 family protein [Sulfitobacter sp. SK012]AXI45172.1 ATPase [Sulfitobacter sp. SK012]
MSDWKAKRFWAEATVEEAEGGFTVTLDGRPVKTPAKRALILPTRKMAQAAAAEWDAQEGTINPALMPVTKTANAAIDKVAIQHAEVADMLAAYADSDLLCYRADQPESLVARQNEIWDPMLDWVRQEHGIIFHTRIGVVHVPQSEQTRARATELTHQMGAFDLAAFHDLVSLSGSWVLGLAASQNARFAGDIWDISRLDERWQAEQWGADEDAESMAALKQRAFEHAKRMFDLSDT